MVSDAARTWRYDDLVAEGVALIPAYAPDWTDHNASDPGITIVELFAYLTEILAYRALRITPNARNAFLRLLDGATGLDGAPSAVIVAAIQARIAAMATAECAVTPGDFEALAVAAAAPLTPAPVYARCVPERDLRRAWSRAAPGEVSVVLAADLDGDAMAALCDAVAADLAPRCLLTTRVHVVPAVRLEVFVGARVAPLPGVSLAEAVAAIDAELRDRFALRSVPSPFGRALHLGAVAAAIDRAAGVDYVEDLVVRRIRVGDDDDALVGVRIGKVAHTGTDTRLGGAASAPMRRLETDRTGEAVTVRVNPWEVVSVRLAPDDVDREAPS